MQDRPRDIPSTGALWPASLCLAAAALVAVGWRLCQAWHGRELLSDDAYYYLIAARNFVETGRFTFDGISQTNGFHPLLFWLEAAAYAVFGTGASTAAQYRFLVAGTGAVFLLTLAGAVAAVHRRPVCEDEAAVQAALAVTLGTTLLPRFTAPYLGGMESILVLPLLLLTCGLAWRRRYLAAGLVAALLVMARLDTAPYVVGPLGLICAWRQRAEPRRAVQSGLAMVAPAALATGLLMLWNWSHFGHAMPIHGALKSCFPRIHWQWYQLSGQSPYAQAPLLALAGATAALAMLIPRGRLGPQARGAALAAAGLCLVQLAALVLFQKWSKAVPAWYFGPAALGATFALAAGLGHRIGPSRLRTVALLAALVAVAANLRPIAADWRAGPRPQNAASAAEVPVVGPLSETIALMRSLPADRTWACTDCGQLAFWSQRRMVNLDGLVNDFHYQDVLRDQGLGRYLHRRGVRYLVFLAWDRSPVDSRCYEPMYASRVAPEVVAGEYEAVDFYVYSYAHRAWSDRVRLPRAAEVWRSPLMGERGVSGRIVVFDLEIALGPKTTATLARPPTEDFIWPGARRASGARGGVSGA